MAVASGAEEDQVISVIGEIGRFQIRFALLISLCYITSAWNYLAVTFMAPPIDYWCERPNGYKNLSVEEWRNVSSPIITQAGKEIHDQCHMYNLNYEAMAEEEGREIPHPTNVTTVPCTRWEYDQSQFNHTIVTEWDLVCDKKPLIRLAQSFYMFGILTGALLGGILSDKIGRRLTLMICLLPEIIFSLAVTFSSSYEVFNFLRWMLGVASAAFGTTAYVLVMEMIGEKQRVIVGNLIWVPWIFGYCGLAGMSYAIRDWQYLQLSIALFSVPLFGLYCFIPESPHWLLTKGRMSEAEQLMRRVAEMNGRTFPEDLILKVPETEYTRGTILDLFRTPNMRKRTFILYFIWFVNSFVYFGLSAGTNDLGGDIYLNFVLSGLVEFPAQFFCLYIMLKRGRKWPLCVTMVVGGVACLSTMAFPSGVYAYEWPTVTMASIGKFGITCSFTIIFIFTVELYPTIVRNVAHGSSATFARTGATVAPFVGILRTVFPTFPVVVYGFSSVVAGMFALLLPETRDHILPNTLEEGEQFGKEQKLCGDIFSDWKRKPKSKSTNMNEAVKYGTENTSFQD